MTGLWKINMVQNYTTKQEFNKLSFKKEDTFSARALGLDGNTKDIIIKLLDGRTFPAKVDTFLNDELNNHLFKFVVKGFDNGNIILKILSQEGNEEKYNNSQFPENLIEDLLNNLDFTVKKEDVNILKGMLKHSIPLNEENFIEIKSFNDFIEKANSSQDEINNFINKYISSKGIDVDSDKGIFIKETLQNFLKEVKELDLNKVLMMKENGIDFNTDEIKAFKKVIDKDFNIFNNVNEIKELIKNEVQGYNKEISYNANGNLNNIQNEDLKILNNKVGLNNINLQDNVNNIKNDTIISRSNNTNGIIGNNENDTINKNQESNLNRNNVENVKVLVKESVVQNPLKYFEIIENFDIKLSAESIKGDIKEKLDLLKDSINEIIKYSRNESETTSKIMSMMENRLNEFKTFNTINNNYYYLNLPIDFDKEQCDCKLIIKDERSKGKKIDSNNVKIATSIATTNMNIVDAYITVLNNLATIDIEVEEKYIKIFEAFKKILVEDLSNNNYVFNVNIKKKIEEFSLNNCSNFFDDNDFGVLNVIV